MHTRKNRKEKKALVIGRSNSSVYCSECPRHRRQLVVQQAKNSGSAALPPTRSVRWSASQRRGGPILQPPSLHRAPIPVPTLAQRCRKGRHRPRSCDALADPLLVDQEASVQHPQGQENKTEEIEKKQRMKIAHQILAEQSPKKIAHHHRRHFNGIVHALDLRLTFAFQVDGPTRHVLDL